MQRRTRSEFRDQFGTKLSKSREWIRQKTSDSEAVTSDDFHIF